MDVYPNLVEGMPCSVARGLLGSSEASRIQVGGVRMRAVVP